MAENQIDKEQVLVFRQTLNITYKRWNVPKRLIVVEKTNLLTGEVTRKTVWRRVTNLDMLITKKDGIGFALWELQRLMHKSLDSGLLPIWESKKIYKVASTVNGLKYSTFHLRLTRIKRGISGGMDAPA